MGFGCLTSKTEWGNATGGPSSLGKKAGSGFLTSVEFTFDVAWTIKALKMLHVDVSKSNMIKEEIFLGAGKVFVLSCKDPKVEDLGEVGTRAVGTFTIGTAGLLWRTDTSDEIWDRIVR